MSSHVSPMIRVRRSPPENLQDRDTHLFSRDFYAEVPKFWVYQAKGVKFDARGQALAGQRGLESLNPRQRASRRGRLKATVSRRQNLHRAVILTDAWSGNYFHWFADVLQRLEFLDSMGRLPQQAPLVLPIHAQNAFAEESLRVYDVEPLVLEQGARYAAADVDFVQGGPTTGNYVPELMQRMRSRFVTRPVEQRSRCLYISRRFASRSVSNEIDLTARLERLGFETVVLEGMALAEQVNLFSSASCVVAPHGAGLTNMLWMPPGARVIEIRQARDSHNNCYFTLASALGIRYFYSQARPDRLCRPGRRPDLIADVDWVVAAILSSA